jgi:hypothetical protein
MIGAPLLAPPTPTPSAAGFLENTKSVGSTYGASQTQSYQSSSQRTKSSSPSRKVALRSLEMLEKPIHYNDDVSNVPAGLRKFWEHLRRICSDVATIPAQVAASFDEGEIFPHNIDNQAKHGSIQQDLTTLRKIHAEARLCRTNGTNEAGWNASVHTPLLACALQPFDNFRVVNVLVNHICHAFSADQSAVPPRGPFPTSFPPMGN